MSHFLSELIEKDSVLSPVLCYSKKKTFEVISTAASKKVGIPTINLLKLLNDREDLGSTYIGNGFVMPHAVIPDDAKETSILLILDKPICYNVEENTFADVFLAFFLHEKTAAEHAEELELICKDLGDSIKIKQLRFIKNISTQVHVSLLRHFDSALNDEKTESLLF